MFQPAASSRSDHRRMFVTVDFFMLIPPGNRMKPSNGSPVTGFRMCSLCTSPTPSTVKALSCPLNLKSIFAVFVGNVFANVVGKIAKTPPPSFPPTIFSIATRWSGFAFGSRYSRPAPFPMWIARGHQRPHANVVPSSFVVPNVPFLMCQDTSASQLPVVGSASKLHGHPQAQLQLWIYSASKFHFVGIGWTPSPRFGNVWRILNRSPEVPISRVRTFISTPAFTTADGGGGSRRADGAPAARHDSRCGGRGSRRRRGLVRDVDVRRFPHGSDGPVDHYVDGPRPVFRASPGHDGRDDAAVGHADDPRVPRPHAARGGADREACGRARNLCFRLRILPRMGCVRGRRVVCIDGAGDPRTVGGGRGAYPRRNARRRRCVASDPDEGGMPETLHLPHGVRHAPLAIRSGRRMEAGASAFAIPRRRRLACHARLVRRGLDEPRVDGRSVDCDSRGEARGK